MTSRCAKTGIVVAAILSVFVARVANKWDARESVAYNMFALMHPYIFPSIETIIERPIVEHIAHFKRLTESMENSVTESSVRFFGNEFWEASYGVNRTRVVEMSAPSTSDPSHLIPIICTCPHNASLETKLPLLLYYFGGGLIMGSVRTEKHLTRWLAAGTPAVVCSIGYRLAPEYPYPTPINDALEGSLSVLQSKVSVSEALEVGIDYDKVATWGMSAGGYMAAQMARRITYVGLNLSCQVSLIPMVKPHSGTLSAVKYWKEFSWPGAQNVYAWSVFLPNDDGTLAADWKVSLLVDPPAETLSRLPPAYIQINTRDVFRDEDQM